MSTHHHALLRPALRSVLLLWRHSGGANSGFAASIRDGRCSCSLAASFSTSSTSTSSPTPADTSSSSSTVAASTTSSGAPADSSFRRGFGVKVALPASDVLGRVLVREPATIKFRAYHLGSRIHVGKVLALLDERSKAVTTTSGKDYAILWLGDSSARLFAGQHESSSHHQQQLAPWQRWQLQQQQPASITSVAAHLSSLAQMVKAWQHQQQQPLLSSQLKHQPVQQPGWPHQQQQQQQSQAVPRLMVIYRVGSVVFAGTEQGEEARLLAAMVPPGVCYSAGHSPWTAAAGVAGSSRRVQAAEEHTVVVDPSLSEEARKGMDQVQLRVLDVGAVRVLTSVLAQSAALAFYERSVNASLEHLSEWRAATGLRAARPQSGVSRLLSGLWAKQQDTVLFKVIAAAALVIEEARRLLDVAEPACYFDRYNAIWGLMAAEFELEQRFKSLELKLNQVEKEAKHDVKDSVARRYHKLERSVVWLLVASCLLAAFDASKKVFLSKNSSSSSSSDDGLREDSSSSIGSSSSGSALDDQPEAVPVRSLV